MASADHDSDTAFGFGPDAQGHQPSADAGPGAPDMIYLNGDVLACACPDCGAPMSIRLWLMVADCWRCGCSIELTEAQEREALRLLREHDRSKREEFEEAANAVQSSFTRKPSNKAGPAEASSERPPESNRADTLGSGQAGRGDVRPDRRQPHRPTPDATEPPSRPPTPVAGPATRDRASVRVPPPPPFPTRRPASGRAGRVRERLDQIQKQGALGVWFSDLLKDMPAWMVSLVLHLVAMLLLGLWIVEPPDDDLSITLSTAESWQDAPGQIEDLDPVVEEPLEFDDPGVIRLEEVEADVRSPGESLVALPRPLVGGPRFSRDLPTLSKQLMVDLPLSGAGYMLSGRDPEIRAQIAERSGGTSATEAAVSRGLKFLARHQSADGSWSLNRFNRVSGCDGQCDGAGNLESDMAATAMALLPFLGAGQLHTGGEYASTVFRGLKWIVERQSANGDLRGDGRGRMYAHAQAAIALCEAYALSRDEQLHEPAQRALDFIIKAQHEAGGWRYEPKQPGDTSVVGWQVMALRSGQMGYLVVPAQVFTRTGKYLDAAQTDRIGGRYAYQPGGNARPSMTAEALLCRQYLGWPRDHRGMRAGVNYLANHHPPRAEDPNLYYWYYATQVMHHYGGSVWERWNRRMRDVLISMQEKTGHAAGSWAPRGGHSQAGGRIYMTALAVCTLEVYYRHLPIYQSEAWKSAE